MFRFVPLLTVGFCALLAGCKSVRPTAGEAPADLTPGLLVGPEATGKAPPPVELPAKETSYACLVTAQNYEKEGRVEDAIKLYEKARAADPANAAPATRRLAALYDKAGDFGKSEPLYDALVKGAPKDAGLLNDYGYSRYCRGDWAGAAAVLAQAVQLDPKHQKAWINLGMAQAQLGQLDASFQSFCNAVRPADAHCNIAFALAVQGKTEDAKAQYRQALALDPGSRVAQMGLARLEKPPQPPSDRAATPKSDGKKTDLAAAAAKVPSVAEIEARLKKEGVLKPVELPEVEGGPENPQ